MWFLINYLSIYPTVASINYDYLIFFRVQDERLEVEPNTNSELDFSQIVKENKTVDRKVTNQQETVNRITESEESAFVDDPDVPPLIWEICVHIVQNVNLIIRMELFPDLLLGTSCIKLV